MNAFEAAHAINNGIKKLDSSIETVLLPIADGGEGTAEILALATDGYLIEIPVLDPLGREIFASYGVLGNRKTCVIEMAAASGITLLMPNELNPRIASTYGTGQLIKNALDRGFRELIICLGGSATNDAGVGMLRALGLRLLDEYHSDIAPTIAGLKQVKTIDWHYFDPRLKECRIIIASDVMNPLLGEQGATAVFGQQKGIKREELLYFESILRHWANIVEAQTNIRLHGLRGAGAAGGTGSALLGFLQAEFQQGIEVVLNSLAYNDKLQEVDYIITGEGQSDAQTLNGKAPFGVLKRATQWQIPTILLSGNITGHDEKLLKNYYHLVASVVDEETSLTAAMKQPEKTLENATYKLFKQLLGK